MSIKPKEQQVKQNKTLYILDLDHTLIYASYKPDNGAPLLHKYGQYLYVLERPMARELITMVQQNGDVVVYTSALADYARRIVKNLKIKPISVFTRNKCKHVNNTYLKSIPAEMVKQYQQIVIIDDSPLSWPNLPPNVKLIVPKEFFGKAEDLGLQPIINELKTLKSNRNENTI